LDSPIFFSSSKLHLFIYVRKRQDWLIEYVKGATPKAQSVTWIHVIKRHFSTFIFYQKIWSSVYKVVDFIDRGQSLFLSHFFSFFLLLLSLFLFKNLECGNARVLLFWVYTNERTQYIYFWWHYVGKKRSEKK
jgi:hypothetical protein